MARGRRGGEQTRSLTAAATRINMKKVAGGKALAKRGAREWQVEAWAYFDEVPEVKYGIRFLGNAFAKLRLFVAVMPLDADPDADPVPVSDEASDIAPELAAAANAELARLRGTLGGQASLQARMNMNLEVAGELYLIGWAAKPAVGTPGTDTYQPPVPEDWQVCSVQEVQQKGPRWFVKQGPNDSKGREVGDDDTIIRLWEQHPAWSQEADCAMRGVLNDCKTLQVLIQQQYAEGLSRQNAGILLVPSELSTGPASPTEPEGDDPTDPFIEELMIALTSPIEDPSSASSVVPWVIRGNGEALEKLRHIVLSRQTDGTLDSRIMARIERIARGMNLPVEVVMGHQQTTYANAEQVDQDTYEDHLEPRCRLLVDALSVGFLRPNLHDTGQWDPAQVERLMVWFDASALIRQPDTDANADNAFDRFAISDAAYRRSKGYTEDDAPEPLEVLVRSGLRRGTLSAQLTAALIDALAQEAGVALPSAAELSAPAAPGDAAARAQLIESLVAAAFKRGNPRHPGRAVSSIAPMLTAARRRRNPGADLTAIDRDLRTRLHVAAEAAMTRALDRAGARLRSRSSQMRQVLSGVENRFVAATLGQTLALQAATTDELLDGAWDDLAEQFYSWSTAAAADAVAIVGTVAPSFSGSQADTLRDRFHGDIAAAWVWMAGALTALAADRLFDPNPAAPPLGEFDATMRVPPGLVRQSVARAGGATGLITSASGAYVALTDGGTRPAGGIGTGELMRDTFRDEGIPVEGYRWVYGPARRSNPFEPHQQLDGVEFVNFDDDVLTNSEGWPEFSYYLPGDHDGCVCDVEPIIIPASEV